MAGIPLNFSTYNTPVGASTRISVFISMNTLFTHTTALVDIDAGALGYIRLTFDPADLFRAEALCGGVNNQLALCPGGFPINTNEWYWISIIAGSVAAGAPNHKFGLYGQIFGPGGATPGMQTLEQAAPTTVQGKPTCSLGWGVPLSSAWNPFPYTPSSPYDAMAELCIETFDSAFGGSNDVNFQNVRPMPTAPIVAPTSPTTVGIVALYHCNEALGSGGTIHDATANGYDLAPGPNNDAIVAYSPFG